MPVPPQFPKNSLRGLAPAWTLAYVASVFAAAAVGIIGIASKLDPARFWSLGAVSLLLACAAGTAGLLPIWKGGLWEGEAERLLKIQLQASRRETEKAVDTDIAPTLLKKPGSQDRKPRSPVIAEDSSDG